MNDQLTPINKDHLKKLIRAELEPTWFDKQSVSLHLADQSLSYTTY
ncbi:hypothetical protein VCRA2121O157_130145 [Vibrio crassostreae]|nr:hypothetical protein VCRA2113O138_120008 [Vibrio crassostreae]CAK1742126.1 hypothetical protein VCRA2113O140_130008 [Vibrio crassostreae]CAK1780032.1 hypothetical protein VCRA2113O137_150008 [Vibrio crassostreae]CAK1839593.1 hypothetical protein VCRA2119O381_1830009 [Vibrio crassostreae]CAK2250806.1 hypothetical protein VCRA2116O141_130008 [Vibrio crassostreae]